MAKWEPEPIWEGEDAYVIGGGPSLREFDWSLLHGKNTVGCNSAFSLGAEVCKIVVFGDAMWWEKIGREGTEKFGGLVVGCSPRLHKDACPWLLKMDRHARQGLGTEGLGWNGNTGSLAINLALILGARRVFLLGFDMKLDMKLDKKRRANWHELRYEDPKAEVYHRFCLAFVRVGKSLPKVFPGREVINLTEDSNLDVFPKASLVEHFSAIPVAG